MLLTVYKWLMAALCNAILIWPHLPVDGDLPSPDLCVVYDVIMEQRAGVDHLADPGHQSLELREPGRGDAQVRVDRPRHGQAQPGPEVLTLAVKIVFRHGVQGCVCVGQVAMNVIMKVFGLVKEGGDTERRGQGPLWQQASGNPHCLTLFLLATDSGMEPEREPCSSHWLNCETVPLTSSEILKCVFVQYLINHENIKAQKQKNQRKLQVN